MCKETENNRTSHQYERPLPEHSVSTDQITFFSRRIWNGHGRQEKMLGIMANGLRWLPKSETRFNYRVKIDIICHKAVASKRLSLSDSRPFPRPLRRIIGGASREHLDNTRVVCWLFATKRRGSFAYTTNAKVTFMPGDVLFTQDCFSFSGYKPSW